jgi:exodeoxyribonuclease VII small subunit
MARKKSDTPEESGSDTFESSLSKLEAIVEAMENSQLPLEDLVKHYEEGSVLLRTCDALLHSARERIELITLRASTPATDSSEEPQSSASTQSEDNDNDDDIRLF